MVRTGVSLGAFELHSVVGRGGMAQVWSAVHRRSGRAAAVKVITAGLAGEARFAVRFAHEVRAVARLDHPAVVRVFDHGTVPVAAAVASGGALPAGAPYLAMEWIEGGALSTGPAAGEWGALRDALLGLIDGLAHAHARGVIHRDLKDDNVLRAARGPVLTDFGLAFDVGGRGAGEEVAGTPGYMAPEQIRGQWRNFGPALDLYSLGCLGWALWCGELPLGGRGSGMARMMAHLLEEVPPARPRFAAPVGFEAWLRRLLAKEPGERFAFAADAGRALRAVGGVAGSVDARAVDVRANDARAVDAKAEAPAVPLLGVGRALLSHRVAAPVGREGARDRLWRSLLGVQRGDGLGVVVIEGPSGYGKSHLAGWLAEQAHERGVARVLRATHQQPSGPECGLRAMLGRFLRCGGAEAAEVAGLIGRLPGAVLRAVDVAEIGAVLSSDGEFAHEGARVRLVDPLAWDEGFARALSVVCGERPGVVIVDDVQWGAAARRTVAYLAEHHADLAALVVLTVRTDGIARGSDAERELGALRARHGTVTLRLDPLDGAAHRRLLQAMLPLEPSLADALVERSGGNPLFGAEMLRYWIGAGLLEDGPEGYRLVAGAADAIPRGMEAVWTARLHDALGAQADETRHALQLAATLGGSVHGDEWTGACRAAGVPWPRVALERLLDVGLMGVSDDGRWVFAHAMLRETLQAHARTVGRSGPLHAACAVMLAGRAGVDPAGVDPARLAEHLLGAGRDEEALGPLGVATGRAFDRGELGQVPRLVARRVGALRRLRVGRGDVRWLDVRLDQAQLDQRQGRFGAALRRADRAVGDAARLGDAARESRALYVRASAVCYLKGAAVAVADLEAALPLCRAAGDRRQEAWLLAECASMAAFLGRFDDAERSLRLALARLDGMEGGVTEARCLHYLAMVASFRGDCREGIARCRVARARWVEAGVRQYQAISLSLEGDLLRRLGDLVAAERAYGEGFALIRTFGPRERCYQALDRGLLRLAQGRFVEARGDLEVVVGEGISTFRGVCAAGLLACAAGVGDWVGWDAGVAGLAGVLAGAPISPDVPWAAGIGVGLAEAAGEVGRAGVVRGVVRDYQVRWQGGGGGGGVMGGV